jgi:protein involved in polysaccharide export with SLBB domain
MNVRARILGWGITVAAVFAVAATAAAEDGPLPPPARPGSAAGAPPAPGRSAARLGGETAPSTAPRGTVAASVDYRLSAGDEVEIEVVLPSGAEADNPVKEPKRILVAPGGVLDLPRIRGVRLEGRSRKEVEQDVLVELGKTLGQGLRAEVFVRVVAYGKRYVYLVDAAFDRIEVSPFERARLLHVLAQAGKAIEEVDVNRIRILSMNGSIRTVDMKQVLTAGGASPDSWLEAGDVLILAPRPPRLQPAEERIYVAGNVKQPGAFRYLSDPVTKKPLTLLKALTAAGWVSEFANLKRVVIRRFTETDPSMRTVDVVAILRGDKADEILQPDDVIYVD